jgi:photosystem II stability/assembly factor-like uncharacterized protein
MKPKLSFLVHSMTIILLLLLPACGGKATEPPALPQAGEIVFAADNATLQSGECTTLRWEATEGFEVILDGQKVDKTGEMEVCPTETRIYALSVDLGASMERREVEIIVGGAGEQPEASPESATPVTPVIVMPVIPEISGTGIPAYQSGTWVSTGGPPGGLGYDIRMDPRNPDVMYVTDAYGGAFKSLDGGVVWSSINNGITTRTGFSGDAIPVFSLTIDPNNPDTIWVGTQFSSGVFRSDDAGQNWQAMNNGILETTLSIRGFTVEPENSKVVYLAGEISSSEWNGQPLKGIRLDRTRGAVYKTENGGQNWTRIWYGDNLARYIWINPQDHNLIYVSTGIFDREAANSDPVALEPGGLGILRSRDGGATWEVLGIDNGFRYDELYVGSLFMHPQDPNILIAASGNDPYMLALGRKIGAIYLTEDGGDTWARVLELTNASAVEICTSNPDVVYAGSRTGIHRSLDGGHTWEETAGNLWGSADVLAGFPIDMQCDPRNPQRIFINNYIGGNFLSEDGGETWYGASQGYTGALMSQIEVAPQNPFVVYTAERMGVFVSRDGGGTWQGTGYGVGRAPEAQIAALDPFDPNHVLAFFVDAGPYPFDTRDGGQSWNVVDGGVRGTSAQQVHNITRIAFSPQTPGLIFAALGRSGCMTNCVSASADLGLMRSVDSGKTWTQVLLTAGQVMDLDFSYAGDQGIYASVSPDEIYRSTDGGANWTLIAQGILAKFPGSNENETLGLVALGLDSANKDRLYAGLYRGGVLTSQDGGQTWQITSAGMVPEAGITDIEIDRATGVIYVSAQDSGVFYSTDGGKTWTSLNKGLLTRAVVSLALSADGSVLYAATVGGGVFRLGALPAAQP